MTELEETYYQLPAVMAVPFRPEGTVKPLVSMDPEDIKQWGSDMFSAVDGLLDWSKEMHSSIYDNYIPQTDRIENMNMVGETLTERPDAIGSRRFFYHRPNRTLYLDVRYGGDDFWDIVFSTEAAIVALDTTDFDNILGPLDADLQHAMDTLDDHTHPAEQIPVDTASFNGVLGSLNDDVQSALNTLDDLDDVFLMQDGTTPLTGDWDAGAFDITVEALIGGDFAGGDYAKLDANGLYLYGEATQWDDLLGAAVALEPGANSPSWSTFLGNTKAWHFAFNLDQSMHGSYQFSHSYEEGTDIEFHIHWTPTTTNTGSVKWELEYTWQSVNGTFSSPTVLTIIDPADGTAYKHQIAAFSTISGVGQGLSSIMLVRVRRLGSEDDYTGSAALLYADIHYKKNSLGSDEEYVKGP